MDRWQDFRLNDVALVKYRQCGTGLLCGTLVGLDIDVLDETAAEEIYELAHARLGRGPSRIGQAPKVLIAYRTTVRKRQTPVFVIEGQPAKVEALADGQQFVAFAIHSKTKAPYIWPDGDPLDVPLAELPEVFEIAGEAFDGVAGPMRIVCNSGLDEADIATARAAEHAMRTEWCDGKPELMAPAQRPRTSGFTCCSARAGSRPGCCPTPPSA